MYLLHNRISGRAGHVARLRSDFDGGSYRLVFVGFALPLSSNSCLGADYDITDCPPADLDPHAVASVFKAYLRERMSQVWFK